MNAQQLQTIAADAGLELEQAAWATTYIKLIVAVPHRNNKGLSILAVYENATAYSPRGWDLEASNATACQDIARAVREAAPDYKHQAKAFLNAVRLATDPGRQPA